MGARAFWWGCVLAAPPIAWAGVVAGFGIAVVEPARDVGLLLLWSCAEEVVFRGFVQPRLARVPPIAERAAIGGISAANLLTSVLFSLAHLVLRTPALAAGVFPVSLLLGASLERSGRLWVPVALHCWFNVCLYAASSWLRPAG